MRLSRRRAVIWIPLAGRPAFGPGEGHFDECAEPYARRAGRAPARRGPRARRRGRPGPGTPAGSAGAVRAGGGPGRGADWALAHTGQVRAGTAVAGTYPWVPQLGLELALRVGVLGWLMVLLVGGIGALVLVYSARYFAADDEGLGRFAAVFLAFAGAMLGLVVCDDLLLLYVFWELTTVFSYLLIGHDPAPAGQPARRHAGPAGHHAGRAGDAGRVHHARPARRHLPVVARSSRTRPAAVTWPSRCCSSCSAR